MMIESGKKRAEDEIQTENGSNCFSVSRQSETELIERANNNFMIISHLVLVLFSQCKWNLVKYILKLVS